MAERLMAAGIECFRLQFPEGMDANEYALKVTPAVKSLGLLIRKALWMGKGAAPTRPEAVAVVVDAPETPIASALAADPSLAAVPPAPTLPPLPASPMPDAPRDVPVAATDKEITLTLGEGKDDVLGRSLDELPPQTRRLLQMVDAFVAAEGERLAVKRADVRFTRRGLREAIAWGDTQLKVHLARLTELEYLVAYRDNSKGKAGGFDYELIYDLAGDGDALRFPGLADIEALRCAYDGARSGSEAARSGSGRGLVGPRSVGSRGHESPVEPHGMGVSDECTDADRNTHVHKGNGKSPSYPQAVALPLAAAGA